MISTTRTTETGVSKITFHYLKLELVTKQVCVKPHLSDLKMTLPITAVERMCCILAIHQYLLQVPILSSKPAAHHCHCRSTGQTDTQQLHRACSVCGQHQKSKLIRTGFLMLIR